MWHKTIHSFLVLFLLSLWSCKSDKQEHAQSLHIAVSANMQFAMEEIAALFEKDNKINITTTVASSGVLFAQIREGAPYDIFLSANIEYPTKIAELGLSYGKPQVYVNGNLVLWTINDTLSLNQLLNQKTWPFKIAYPNPDLAPYGKAGLQFLKNKNIQIDQTIIGESISQVNQFVSSGVVDVGFTAKSAVLSNNLSQKGKWIEIPATTYEPIKQASVVLNKNKNRKENALAFQEFLTTAQAKEIFLKFGYSVLYK